MNLLRHAVTERELQQSVIDLARLNGWLVYHTFDSRRSEPGFPDLVLVRAGQPPIFAELKSQRGKVSPAQGRWGHMLLKAGADYRLWRPSDWPEIEETLTRRYR